MDAGLPVVLASDYNPGSCPSGSMPFVVSLACAKMKMLPEEAVNAATSMARVPWSWNRITAQLLSGKLQMCS